MSSTRRGKKSGPEMDRKYTPDALAVALVDCLPSHPAGGYHALEPSVGGGAFVRALRARNERELFAHMIVAIDVDEYAQGLPEADIFACWDFLSNDGRFNRGSPDLIIGNPPFDNAELHIRKALEIVAPGGTVAFLLRLNFLGSIKRRDFWKEHPPSRVIVLTPRPSFTNGGTDSCEYTFVVWNDITMKGIEWLAWR